MCGIAGIFDRYHGDPQPPGILQAALKALHRRGPDAGGVFQGPGFTFGHRRLVIIDREGGLQPFVDPETGHVLVYNGELYNFRSLRSQLERLGYTFQTRSDTEVVLKAWRAWGPDALTRFNGMFAFGLYDPARDALFLARDHLGIKPLYYCPQGHTLAFASSLASLMEMPGIPRQLHLGAASHYLSTVRLNLGAQTLLRGIYLLEPGTYLELARYQKEGPRVRSYWRLPAVRANDKALLTLDEAALSVRELLDDSVAQQLVSDVPLGGFLSGGLDSAILARLAASRQKYTAYAVGYGDTGNPFGPQYQEWEYVRAMAQHLGIDCREEELRETDYVQDWELLLHEKGLPLSTPNEVGIYRLARALRREFTVGLSGEGADEVFGGYLQPYLAAYDFDRAAHRGLLDAPVRARFQQNLQDLYGQESFSHLAEHHLRLNSWIPLDWKPHLLRREAWDALHGDAEIRHFYYRFLDNLRECSTLDRYLHLHARVNLEGLLLRLDSSTMAASVEGRVPYTDPRLVSFVFQLPDAYKIDWVNAEARQQGQSLNARQIEQQGLAVSKILLRQAFFDDLPPSIIRRPKMSFPVPIREWLGGHLHDWARQVIRESAVTAALFDRDHLEHLITELPTLNQSHLLWPLVNLAWWVDAYDVEVDLHPAISSLPLAS